MQQERIRKAYINGSFTIKKYDLDLFAQRYIEVVNDGR